MLIAERMDSSFVNIISLCFLAIVFAGYFVFRYISEVNSIKEERKRYKESLKKLTEESKIRSKELEKLTKEVLVRKEQFSRTKPDQRLLL